MTTKKIYEVTLLSNMPTEGEEVPETRVLLDEWIEAVSEEEALMYMTALYPEEFYYQGIVDSERPPTVRLMPTFGYDIPNNSYKNHRQVRAVIESRREQELMA